MILYHGSWLEISRPVLIYSRPNLDLEQAFILHLFMNRL